MEQLRQLFGTDKPVIGMLHLLPLPESPQYDPDGGMEKIISRARADYEALIQGGIDGLIFCNENDKPYQFEVGPQTVAAMTAIIAGVTNGKRKTAVGVDVQWDPRAAIAVAHAVSADFVRGIFTGVYYSDLGLFNTTAASLQRFRRSIGADRVKLYFNLVPEFSTSFTDRPLHMVAKTTVAAANPDMIGVSGMMFGQTTSMEQIAMVKAEVPDTPVFANTGITAATVQEILAVADGCVVGTSIKEERKPGNRISADYVADLMRAARAVQEKG